MKKNDILNAVDQKKKKKNVSTVKKNTKKKTNTNKKTTTKKSTIKPVEKVTIVEEKKPIIEEVIEEVKTVENIPFKIKLKKFLIKFAIIVFFIIILLLVLFTVFEYKTEDREKVDIKGEGYFSLNIGDSFNIMTWNIGYGALGDNADFFMDYGKMVQTADRNRINNNLEFMREKISELKPNILFLQEVDVQSKRASHVNELSSFQNHFNNYSSAFATNFKVFYLPYPIGDSIGSVHSGIATFSKYTIQDAERIQLPSSFIWPVSTMNLKRCLLVTHIPIKDSEKELVLINLHLEAYDSGKGKELQTEKLLEILKEESKKDNYIIVGGDFNQTFSSVDSSMYPVGDKVWKPGSIDVKDFGEDYQFIMDNAVPSCRSLDKPYKDADKENFQYYLIDGYIVSKNIVVNSVNTKDFGFTSSDHNPVVMNVTIS